MTRQHACLIAAITLLVLKCGAQTYAVTVEDGVAVKMRDGVVLRADVYRPETAGRFPVLLERTPYDKRNSRGFAYRAAAHGYVAVVEDVRGRYSSEGDWYPFLHESQDGYDTVEWAASLPYSDGRVGMFGGSYVGATQMLAAIAHPPHLAGICPVVTASNYHENWTYQGGAFEQWFDESWTSGLAQDTLNRLVQRKTNAMEGMWKLPLAGYPLFNFATLPGGGEATAQLAPYFLDWLAHPNYDEYWKRWSIEDHFGDITVPALTTAAWYDIFQGGSLRNYSGIKAHGGSEASRRGQHLLVVVGGHAGFGRKIGDVEFGPAAEENDEDDVTLRWYDFLFRGVKNEFTGKPVRIFVMGRNEWRDEDDWPLARARQTRWYLHSDGHAASLRGDGKLSTAEPGAEPADRFVYDPANPVPTIGGPLCCDSAHLAPGPRDQRPAEARDDVLIYSAPAFDHDMEVTGPVRVELYAASAAVDTDFTAKLVDVWPNGFAQNLTEGIVRARFRGSREAAELMNPGEVYRFDIDLWATSNVFRRGHALRLEISSSNFPRFDRNLNTGTSPGSSGGGYITATQIVYHDARHASALVLPMVE